MSYYDLIVSGSGLKYRSHMTAESEAWIKKVDKVFFAEANPMTTLWLKELNPNTVGFPHYLKDRSRMDTYHHWVNLAMESVREGQQTCVVLYGHPGVYSLVGHFAVEQARKEGFQALMLPGISAMDCLVADLGIDPGMHGMQSFDASDFLLNGRVFDSRNSLVLWQPGMAGVTGYSGKVNIHGLTVLKEVLMDHYPADHQIYIYEASQYAPVPPLIRKIPLSGLDKEDVITLLSTLFIPQKEGATFDYEMAARLGIDPENP